MGYLAVTFVGFSFLSSQLCCSATWPATEKERSLMAALCSTAEGLLWVVMAKKLKEVKTV